MKTGDLFGERGTTLKNEGGATSLHPQIHNTRYTVIAA